MTEDSLANVPKTGGAADTVDGTDCSIGYLALVGREVYFTDSHSLYRVTK